jgi:gentisate 1,2-dioxygenase
MFWLDGLDIPMVQFFDASFAEGSDEDQQKITRPAGAAPPLPVPRCAR